MILAFVYTQLVLVPILGALWLGIREERKRIQLLKTPAKTLRGVSVLR